MQVSSIFLGNCFHMNIQASEDTIPENTAWNDVTLMSVWQMVQHYLLAKISFNNYN